MGQRFSILVASVIVLLSGCLGAGPKAVPSPDVAIALPEPTSLQPLKLLPEIKLGDGLGEPNIAVAQDGTIYVTPVDHVYRSDDGGRTFQDLGTSKTKGHGDGDTFIESSGRVHWLGLEGSTIPYQYSDDRAQSFSTSVDLGKKDGFDREWLDGTLDGHIFAGWRANAGYAFARSDDHGEHWTAPTTVMGDANGGPLVHDPTNAARILIPYVEFGSAPAVKVARTEDGGKKWTLTEVAKVPTSPADVAFSTKLFPVAAFDRAGNSYLVVSMKQPTLPAAVPKQGSLFAVYLFVSTDHGSTWSSAQQLSAAGKEGIMPFIVAGAAGRVAVVWYESTVGAPSEVAPDVWNVKLLEGLRMQGPAAQQVTLITQLNGQPNHIGSVCSNGLLCVAGGDRSLLDYFEVALTPGGQPAVTWASSTLGTGVSGISGLPVITTTIYTRAVESGTALV